MAQSEKFTPRTKHIALKYHWFKQYEKSGLFDINYVNTHEQLADILTKPLDEYNFKRLRKMLMGYWWVPKQEGVLEYLGVYALNFLGRLIGAKLLFI